MENNEQNNFEATNNVNPVNNVEPTPTVEPTPEVKTEDTIMVAEPATRPAVEPTPAPVAPASQPMPAPEVSSRPEPVVETTPVQPTVEPEPVVIPKGEKPKKNNGLVALLLIIIFILLVVCGYFVYDKYVKDLITKPSTNETSGNQSNANEPINNDNTNQQVDNLTDDDVSALVDKYYGNFEDNLSGIFGELNEYVKAGMALNATIATHNLSISYTELENAGYTSCQKFTETDAVEVTYIKEEYKELFNMEMPEIEMAIGGKIGFSYKLVKLSTGSYYVAFPLCGGPYWTSYNKYSISNYNVTNGILEVYIEMKYNEEIANRDGGPRCYPSGKESKICGYKLTFKNMNGKYILVSSEEV